MLQVGKIKKQGLKSFKKSLKTLDLVHESSTMSVQDFMKQIDVKREYNVEKLSEFIKLSLYKEDLWNPEKHIEEIIEALNEAA